jgi:hypothetical protein
LLPSDKTQRIQYNLLCAGGAPETLSVDAAAQVLPTEAWQRHRETLALKRALDDRDWMKLTTASAATVSARILVLNMPSGSPLPAEHVSEFKRMEGLTRELYTMLMGEDPEAFWRRASMDAG